MPPTRFWSGSPRISSRRRLAVPCRGGRGGPWKCLRTPRHGPNHDLGAEENKVHGSLRDSTRGGRPTSLSMRAVKVGQETSRRPRGGNRPQKTKPAAECRCSRRSIAVCRPSARRPARCTRSTRRTPVPNVAVIGMAAGADHDGAPRQHETLRLRAGQGRGERAGLRRDFGGRQNSCRQREKSEDPSDHGRLLSANPIRIRRSILPAIQKPARLSAERDQVSETERSLACSRGNRQRLASSRPPAEGPTRSRRLPASAGPCAISLPFRRCEFGRGPYSAVRGAHRRGAPRGTEGAARPHLFDLRRQVRPRLLRPRVIAQALTVPDVILRSLRPLRPQRPRKAARRNQRGRTGRKGRKFAI